MKGKKDQGGRKQEQSRDLADWTWGQGAGRRGRHEGACRVRWVGIKLGHVIWGGVRCVFKKRGWGKMECGGMDQQAETHVMDG
eukprot:355923-Chlamydomonas_euryale.AAC.2